VSLNDDILDPDLLPNPAEFFPASEEYPSDLFRPVPARAEIFKNITFIFLDEGQYNALVTPINAGMGKAVVFDAEGKSVEDLVRFATAKGQKVLIRRNLEDDDKLCGDAAKRYYEVEHADEDLGLSRLRNGIFLILCYVSTDP
jgi:Second BRCT domain on Nijmegen syndrome breakage protein